MELKFNAIRNFLKFFLRKAIIEKSEPLFDLSMIELINAFFKTQLRQMEDYSEDDPALSEEEVKIIKEKLTDYPLLQTMFILDLNLGLRASEFVKIKVKQGLISNRKQTQKGNVWIDLSRGILMIYRGKSRSPHLVALTREMVQLVKKQLRLRKLYGVKHEYLFFSKKGKPLRDHSIYPYYLQISKIVGFRVTSHKVRRTMATILEKRGVPHSIIQRRMGHKPKDDTQHYQRFPIQERIQILEGKVRIL
jgi:integrase